MGKGATWLQMVAGRCVRFGLWGLSWALILGLASGCFYTEEINERPSPGIRVIGNTGPYFVNDVVRFDATKSIDDRANELRAEWQALSCLEGRMPRCIAMGCRPGEDCPLLDIDTEFSVTLENHDTVEVQLRVTDSQGATRLQPDIFSIVVGNKEPIFSMQDSGNKEAATGSYVLYRGINITAIGAALGNSFDPDGDEVSYNWQLFPPAGSQSSARSFGPGGVNAYRLIPDVEGQWDIVLRVEDDYGGSLELTKSVFVGIDAPPCLQGMDPIAVDDAYYLVDSIDGARRFSVLSASDALDPFPGALDDDSALGEATFRWLLKAPGAADYLELEGFSGADYLVDPNAYNPGDTLELRVEVSDRVEGPERDLPCADDVWTCALAAGSGCNQRKTWGVEIL